MSKVDAMRALREARFEESGKRKPKRMASTSSGDEGTCTYVSKTSGKRCTRPANHPEKTHRYALKP